MKEMFDKLCSTELLFNAWEVVRAKKSAGGIDMVSICGIEKRLTSVIAELSTELKTGTWNPEPYLRIEIPKKETERRTLGLLTVKDKIVQQAIKTLIEPRFESLFLNNSYGYRPGKGAVKAIRRALHEKDLKSYGWALKLDIDNYFDNIDHELLESRVRALISEEEIVRLIMLCVKMGSVNRGMKWKDCDKGVPQGAVLSPLLANLYLHQFDQSITSTTEAYVRYADDFIIFAHDESSARAICDTASAFLRDRLKLSLNEPLISDLEEGVEFLGITIKKSSYGITDEKRNELLARISEIHMDEDNSQEHWKGILAYYGRLLPENELILLDAALVGTLEKEISQSGGTHKNELALFLDKFQFASAAYRLNDDGIRKQLLKKRPRASDSKEPIKQLNENEKLIRRRKREYLKKESENSELVISKPGLTIGISGKGVTVKSKGKVIKKCPINNLKHITIMADGISLSSNFITFMMINKIAVDLFSVKNGHIGAFLSAGSLQCSFWEKQCTSPPAVRNMLAARIIEGKLGNQLNLVKYYHKYHKQCLPELGELLERLEAKVNALKEFSKTSEPAGQDFIKSIALFESQGAVEYWACLRCLLSNDDVNFEKREHQGASDLVNCLLNYGYAILYSRCWQALLAAQLNPYDSVLHVRQAGKPTFAFDFMEIFRAQTVDRVVISMIQKREPLKIKNGKLSEDTRKLLIKNIMERLYKKEKFRGENRSLEQIIKLQARELSESFISEKKFKPYKAKW